MKKLIKWAMGFKREFEFDPNSTENEGRFRLLPPDVIEKDSYFKEKSDTKGISYVKGLFKGKEVIQAIRFDKSIWSQEKANNWWEKNRTKFKFHSEEK